MAQDKNQCSGCAVHQGTHKPAEALHQQIDEPQAVAVLDERAAFEQWLGIKPCGAAHDFGWSAWQARAALAATPAAAPVVLPEPVTWLIERSAFHVSPHGQDAESNEWLEEAHEPGEEGSFPVYTEQQVRALLATGGQAQAVAHSVAKTEPVWIAARNLNSIRADYQRETGDTHPGNDYWAGRFAAGYVSLMDAVIDLQLKEPATQQADARDADDADLIEWLSGQYLAADFQWGDPITPVLVIEIPATASVCGDFRTDVRAAIAIAAAKEQGQ